MEYLMGPDVSESRLAAISALHHVRRDFPPTLLVTGNHDEMIHWGESLRMYQALSDAGAAAELHIFNGAGHAFDLSPDLGRECAALLTLFLDRHLGLDGTQPPPSVQAPDGATD
jgi:dipeptidyl aminopeptidase/acylaminoacyl peptidase